MKTWAVSFDLKSGDAGMLLTIGSSSSDFLQFFRDSLLHVKITTKHSGFTQKSSENAEFQFELTSPKREGHVQICWLGYSFRLYIDDVLEDEEWPLGEPMGDNWHAEISDCISNLEWSTASVKDSITEKSFLKPFQNFVFPGHNTGVGDCMPFARDGRWSLYYLLDRRSHHSKKGLGAHQWAHISTNDLKHWTIHPMAVSITEQWEGSICTGSLLQKESTTYAFYAIRMADGTPARMTWATSEDGIHFQKSGKYFSLSAPYEPVSARDPMVFLGADNQYHMLVTTSLINTDSYGGCLAHLTSANLTEWTQHEPFIVPGFSDQPECSDYFEWNGWYYLIFSNFAIGRYRMSREPFGPWIRPENDVLDALEVQVPKTAAFGHRRFSSGFLARRPRSYAGNAVTHELFQRPDGTLGIKHLEEILPEKRLIHEIPEIHLFDVQNRASVQIPVPQGDIRLRLTLKPGTHNMLYGIVLWFRNNRRYRIEFDQTAQTVAIVRPGADFDCSYGRDLLRNVDLSEEICVDLMINGDILDMTLSSGRVMTMRLDDFSADFMQTELYAMAGSLTVQAIQIYTLL